MSAPRRGGDNLLDFHILVSLEGFGGDDHRFALGGDRGGDRLGGGSDFVHSFNLPSLGVYPLSVII